MSSTLKIPVEVYKGTTKIGDYTFKVPYLDLTLESNFSTSIDNYNEAKVILGCNPSWGKCTGTLMDAYPPANNPYDIFPVNNGIDFDDIVNNGAPAEQYFFYIDKSKGFGWTAFLYKDGSTIVNGNLIWIRNDQVVFMTTQNNFLYAGVRNGVYQGNGFWDVMSRSIPWINKAGNQMLSSALSWYITYNPSIPISETVGHLERANVYIDIYNTANLNDFKTWIGDYVPIESDDDNPYADGGTSTEDAGDSNFSEDSDEIDLDDLPTLNVIDTGFATLFSPTKSQLQSLSHVMWGGDFVAFLQNMVENIKDMFTSLAIVPFEVDTGANVEVNWFGSPITNVILRLCTSQYYDFNMGSINLENDSRIFTSGSALDYSPFTKLGIFLPFIGYQELDIDECRNHTINLNYRIDVLSGTCVATISVEGNAIYQFAGNCLTQIPISSSTMENLVTDAVNVGIAAVASHTAKGAVSSAGDALGEATKGGKKGEISKAQSQYAHANANLAHSEGHLASATANAAMGMKPSFGHAGSISASASLLSIRQPYLFLTTPRQSMPNHYQRYCGFPSNITGKLNEFGGFTIIESIRLNDLVATSAEIAEIYQLLKEGVII